MSLVDICHLSQYAEEFDLVSLIAVNGTTGEGLSLTVEERQLATEEWVKVGAGR